MDSMSYGSSLARNMIDQIRLEEAEWRNTLSQFQIAPSPHFLQMTPSFRDSMQGVMSKHSNVRPLGRVD